MSTFQTLSMLLGVSFAAGLNLYATVATLGLLHRYQIIKLPESIQAVANPWVLGIAAFLYAVEFVADKVPYVDSVWDIVHTFIRPPAAAILTYAAMGDVSEPWQLGAGLLAGSVALVSHGTKASTRAAANMSPEPFSNWFLSLAEDAFAIFLVWMASTHPVLSLVTIVLLLLASALILRRFFSFLLKTFRKFSRRKRPSPV